MTKPFPPLTNTLRKLPLTLRTRLHPLTARERLTLVHISPCFISFPHSFSLFLLTRGTDGFLHDNGLSYKCTNIPILTKNPKVFLFLNKTRISLSSLHNFKIFYKLYVNLEIRIRKDCCKFFYYSFRRLTFKDKQESLY